MGFAKEQNDVIFILTVSLTPSLQRFFNTHVSGASEVNTMLLLDQGRSQDLGGGGPRIFFFRFGNLHVAKRHAAHGEAMRIARGVRGHASPRKFFKTVQFGAF